MSGWGLMISCHSLAILFGVQWGGDTLEEKQSEESRELSPIFFVGIGSLSVFILPDTGSNSPLKNSPRVILLINIQILIFSKRIQLSLTGSRTLISLKQEPTCDGL